MTGSHQVKGDRHERATTEALAAVVDPFGLTVERQQRTGYDRDAGDVHVLMPARASVLATLQCKDWPQTRWRLPEWLGDLDKQRAFAHADHAALVLKRARVADAARAYALTELHAYGQLLGEVARLRAEVARLRQGRPVAPGPAAAAAGLAHRGIRDVTAFERLMRGPEPDERGA